MKPVPSDDRRETLATDAAAEEDDRLNGEYLLQDDDDDNDNLEEDDTYRRGDTYGDERRDVVRGNDDRRYNSRSPSRSSPRSAQPYRPSGSGAGNLHVPTTPPYNEGDNLDDDDNEEEEEEIDDHLDSSDDEEED